MLCQQLRCIVRTVYSNSWVHNQNVDNNYSWKRSPGGKILTTQPKSLFAILGLAFYLSAMAAGSPQHNPSMKCVSMCSWSQTWNLAPCPCWRQIMNNMLCDAHILPLWSGGNKCPPPPTPPHPQPIHTESCSEHTTGLSPSLLHCSASIKQQHIHHAHGA